MKETILFFSAFLFISFSVIAQTDFLLGDWVYEKIPESKGMNDQEQEMMKDLFGGTKLSFYNEKYIVSMMGRSDKGTWKKLEGNMYELKSSSGMTQEVGIDKISDNQMIFVFLEGKEIQMLKSGVGSDIDVGEDKLASVKGVNIKTYLLYGSWNYNGQIKEGVDDGLILKHDKDEVVNYSFIKGGKFINKAPLGVKLKATWSIDSDKQTLLIKSKNKTESLKVVKLSKSELHLYNPTVDAIIKFIR